VEIATLEAVELGTRGLQSKKENPAAAVKQEGAV
jgi:hypothetical protein